MSRVIPHIKAKGFLVSDLTEKSWHLSKNLFEKLTCKLLSAELNPLSVTVHDLFSNTSIRFKQWDDTLSLGVKLDGVKGWHLAGEAVYTPDSILREKVKLVCTLEKVLGAGLRSLSPLSRGTSSVPAATNPLMHPTRAMKHTQSMQQRNTPGSATQSSKD